MLRVGRNRTVHRRLPVGWKPVRGVIYYEPTNAGDRAIVAALTGGKKSMRLGATHNEAAERYANLIVAARDQRDRAEPGTVAELVQRGREELLPTITSARTREERGRHLATLERLFGTRRYARTVYDADRAPPGEVLRALDVQRHLFSCRETRPVIANREVKTWKLLFQWARAPWGVVTDYNPCAGLMMNAEAPRAILPTDARLRLVYRRCDPPIRFLIAMIRYYGRRRVELLRLQLSNIAQDGLHLVRAKREREIVIRWDPRLRRVVARALRWRALVEARSRVKSTMLLLNRRGQPLSETAFRSAWRRAAERAGVHGEFTFHDLRALRASTLERELATHVLAHDDPRTTAAVYRRGPHVIDMNRGGK